MKLIELTPKKFDNFVVKHPSKSHFLQSSIWGSFVKDNQFLNPFYLGLVDDNNKINAVTLLLQKKLPLGYSYFYAPRGYVLDFNNFILIEEMTKEIKKFVKQKKGIFIKIDPDIPLHKLDSDGNIIKDQNNNYKLVDFLKKIGYRHMGFNKNFENSQPRYTFRLNLTKNLSELEQNFHPTTRNIIHRGNPYQLVCKKNEEASIEEFYLTMMETAKREQVIYHSIDYYRNFYKVLHKHNNCDLYTVTADISKIKKIYKDKIKDFQDIIKSLKEKENTKSKNKIQQYNDQLSKCEKEYQELTQIKEKKLTLSSILTAKYGDKVWIVHGGNHSLLRNLNANYFIYYTAIKDAHEEGYKIMDFFGTTGNPKKDNPIYGIHLFKKRFGGEYTEFIGEFDYVVRPFMYFVFKKLIPIYRNMIRKKAKKELNNEVKGDK